MKKNASQHACTGYGDAKYVSAITNRFKWKLYSPNMTNVCLWISYLKFETMKQDALNK